MIDMGERLSPSRRALWFVTVTAALTSFWFTAFVFIYTVLNHNASRWLFVPAVLALAGGLIGWSLLANNETVRSRLVRGAVALASSVLVLVAAGIPIAIVIAFQCGEGDGVHTVRPLGLFVPAIYYAIGYFGFTRPRRLPYVWPLAVATALIAFLIFGLIVKATSGCSPA
jgi:hypothetical protein